MAFKPYFMKDVDLIIGDEADTTPNFKCQVKSVKLTPDVSVQRVETACPNGQFADMGNPVWTAELGYLYGEDDGTGTVATVLADYLLAHMGETQVLTFRPHAGGKGYQASIKIVPGVIGGEYGSFSDQSVSLPILGQPVPIVAAV